MKPFLYLVILVLIVAVILGWNGELRETVEAIGGILEDIVRDVAEEVEDFMSSQT